MDDLQIDKPGFQYIMRIDDDNTVRSLFWTDMQAKTDYVLYGDFISFDTTFGTNRYNMTFAPIVGINGHCKTIVFGWTLLENQKSKTFRWLLDTFVKVMGVNKPVIIMTDQDAAMKKVIAELWGSTVVHRFCFWHIIRNARENLAQLLKDKEGLAFTLEKLIYTSLTEQEFETGWTTMIEGDADLAKNPYLKAMFDSRKMWVPVFLKKVFCPFI
jgi:hypothetical protein